MRINIYAEELTDKIELVKKSVNQEIFRGIRMYLASPDVLHHSDSDNDESAVTIWVPWTKKGGHDFDAVLMILAKMNGVLYEEKMKYDLDKASQNT